MQWLKPRALANGSSSSQSSCISSRSAFTISAYSQCLQPARRGVGNVSTHGTGMSCTANSSSKLHIARRFNRGPRPCRSSTPAAAGVGVFPAGQKQARMELPALLVFLQAGALLDAELAPQMLDQVNDAVTAGATAVVLYMAALHVVYTTS
eukprot:GHRQ01039016.1.p1 GENE.GHRQ01039016.1~~GHRQ01039016.1.p1  ORF type:complete len:151 (+),score=41.35 GHRQ01039016.1:394-846(+)